MSPNSRQCADLCAADALALCRGCWEYVAWWTSTIWLPFLLRSLACSLSACAVAGILVGDIDKWNDPVLKKLNPEVGP